MTFKVKKINTTLEKYLVPVPVKITKLNTKRFIIEKEKNDEKCTFDMFIIQELTSWICQKLQATQ